MIDRLLRELIDVYHQIVGRNCVLMFDLTPDRSGDFIRSCYGNRIIPSF
jgi:hypothetical protein